MNNIVNIREELYDAKQSLDRVEALADELEGLEEENTQLKAALHNLYSANPTLLPHATYVARQKAKELLDKVK